MLTNKGYADLYVRRLKKYSAINITYISVSEKEYLAKQIIFDLDCESLKSSFISILYL